MMNQTVEQSRGHLLIRKQLTPFRERQIGCDDDTGGFMQLADEMEQQSPAFLAEWQVAQLI